MIKDDSVRIEVISMEGFKFLYVKDDPPRLEAKIIFNKDHISQRLIFKLMNITHTHGFGCSAPIFSNIEDPSMTFVIGTILPSVRQKQKYITRLIACLIDIHEFTKQFINQLDFSRLDLTMFNGIDLGHFYPEQFAAIRDQHYGGSWDKFYNAMRSEKRFNEAEVIKKCHKFEQINKKDIGLVGHKLTYVLSMLNTNLKNIELN